MPILCYNRYMRKTSKKPKTIGIDARFYGPIGKGLGRYTQEMVDNIIRIDKDNQYVIFLGKDNFQEFKTESPPVGSAQGLKIKKVLADARWYTLKEQVLMPWLFWRERLDLVHVPHFNAPIFNFKKLVVTIHDLILVRFPTARATTLGPLMYKIKNLGYKLVIWLAVKRAKKIIAVSKYTKDDIVKHFKIRPDKVRVIYEGVANLAKNRDTSPQPSPSEGEGERVRLNDKDTLLGYNINNPFLLYVGNAYPHKNLEGLIKVFGEVEKDIGANYALKFKNSQELKIKNQTTPNPSLSKEGGESNKRFDLQLVLVGKEDYFYRRVKNYAKELNLYSDGKDSAVVFPGYVPDAKLEILFKNALAYVFPSFYEGFGLPPLEAMAKGCPVVSSDKSCLPEILGQAALYFNPDNKAEMEERILRIMKDDKLRNELIQKGFSQAKKYSWREAARKTLEVYEDVLSKQQIS